MVVCGGLWWFVVVCVGVWWCVVVCGGLWWCVVVCGFVWPCMVLFCVVGGVVMCEKQHIGVADLHMRGYKLPT